MSIFYFLWRVPSCIYVILCISTSAKCWWKIFSSCVVWTKIALIIFTIYIDNTGWKVMTVRMDTDLWHQHERSKRKVKRYSGIFITAEYILYDFRYLSQLSSRLRISKARHAVAWLYGQLDLAKTGFRNHCCCCFYFN